MAARTARRIAGVVAGLALSAAQAQPADRLTVDGSTGVMPLVAALARDYEQRRPGVVVVMGTGLGTKARLAALTEGKIDIALASHGLAAEELARQGLAAREIARIAVVFGVHASVPIAGLSAQQICDIYAGRLRDWRAVSGPDLAIAPLARPDSEVDSEVIRDKIGCLKDLRFADPVKLMPRSGDMAKALAAMPGAIGVTTMTVVEQSRGQIKALLLNARPATAENVKTGTYELVRASYLVTKVPPTPAIARFLEFVLSAEGRAIIAANGAVPVP
jgi:phosphate transport system substrate-binding protein